MLAKRVDSLEASPTLAMGKKAKDMIADGIDVVNLSQGEPDFNTPDNIGRAARIAIKDHLTDSYTATNGLVELKNAVVAAAKRDYNVSLLTDQVVITTGAKLALYALMQILVDPGDLVITSAPFWVSYSEQVKLAGGSFKAIVSSDPQFKLTIDDLNKLEEKPKVVILNTPNNPSGAVYSKNELESIISWTKTNDVYLILDEIYGKLVYGDTVFHSGLSLESLVNSKMIIINGVSKAYAMTGWRIGWAIADVSITHAMTKILGHLTSNPTVVAQYAAIEALNGQQKSVETMRKSFESRLNFLYRDLSEIDNISIPFKPSGSFYIFFKIDSKFMKKNNFKNTNEISMALLSEEKLAIPSGEGFGMPGYLRLSYAKSEAELIEAVKRLKHFFS
ncbi:pyridoxal phosphate-dependent aminotransferase [Leuconostoc falkenbergense]|uniref:pyridoxal phosphate-dependent aminotransferase n=1 Tax=Leuconostoc falkenbergense TaxID=2766470 RepID=UPI0039ECC8C3